MHGKEKGEGKCKGESVVVTDRAFNRIEMISKKLMENDKGTIQTSDNRTTGVCVFDPEGRKQAKNLTN